MLLVWIQLEGKIRFTLKIILPGEEQVWALGLWDQELSGVCQLLPGPHPGSLASPWTLSRVDSAAQFASALILWK